MIALLLRNNVLIQFVFVAEKARRNGLLLFSFTQKAETDVTTPLHLLQSDTKCLTEHSPHRL
ncbi:MAG: hypothetical protein ICV51_14995 [Flavisolibacter sp.]|nr:hypothetical protein [Flavisolibacter sp.]MBD0376924.1 hypothetical protein [Flavisolibacter sp.]